MTEIIQTDAAGSPVAPRTAKKHVIAGSRMISLWECDGHGKNHDASKWGYFAMPLLPSSSNTVAIYCRKTIDQLEALIEKTDAEAAKAVSPQSEAVKPEMVFNPTRVHEADSGALPKGGQEAPVVGQTVPVVWSGSDGTGSLGGPLATP